jgi:hypothetical protein
MKEQIQLPLISDILVVHPGPKYDRRLSDKILAAFSHAYEVGERGMALQLRRVLEDAEHAAAANGERRGSTALHQADRLVEFVDAREAYKQASARTPADPEELDQTSRELLEAYRRWSDS